MGKEVNHSPLFPAKGEKAGHLSQMRAKYPKNLVTPATFHTFAASIRQN
jgi:hypothetical protein